MNPIAVLYMKNGKKIVIELLPEAAPNTVNSFIYVASAVSWITTPSSASSRAAGSM